MSDNTTDQSVPSTLGSLVNALFGKEDMTMVSIPTRLIPLLLATMDAMDGTEGTIESILADPDVIAARIVHAQSCPECADDLKVALDKQFQQARHDIAVGDAPDGTVLTPLGVTI